MPELRAVAGLAGVELAIDPEEEAALLDESVFLQVRVAPYPGSRARQERHPDRVL